MRGNFGLKLQNSPKLPHIHARFFVKVCNAKGYWGLSSRDTPTTMSFATILLFIDLLLTAKKIYIYKFYFLQSIFFGGQSKTNGLTRGWIEVDSWLEIDLVSRMARASCNSVFDHVVSHVKIYGCVCGKSWQVFQSFKWQRVNGHLKS